MIPSSDSSIDRHFLQEVVQIAFLEARKMQKDYLGTPHLFLALTQLNGGCTVDALQTFKLTPKQVSDVFQQALGTGQALSDIPILPTRRCKEILNIAEQIASDGGLSSVDERSIAQAVLSEKSGVTFELLNKIGIKPAELIQRITNSKAHALLEKEIGTISNRNTAEIESPIEETKYESTPVKKNKTLLEQFGRDLTQLARSQNLSPLIGRAKEMRLLIQSLMLKDRNNPILIGDSGVGKTTIIEGLAQLISDGNVPSELKNKRLIELSTSAIVAGTRYRGDFEDRLLKILDEAVANKDIILFIDEMHLLIGTGKTGEGGGGIDAAGLLKPVLVKSRLRCIGATTPQEFRIIEKDVALQRRLRPIIIEEPTQSEALAILTNTRSAYEEHHHVRITDEALEATIQFSIQYLPNLRLPDKACSILDEACAQTRIIETNEDPIVTPNAIATIITQRTGIPIALPNTQERDHLLDLESTLKQKVIGQDEAVTKVVQAIQITRAGLKQNNRPMGVFLFIGPTGVGKTELSRALATEVFGSSDYLIRIDMSEYMEKHAVSRLIGAPPGYAGYDQEGQLTGKLKRRPYCVVLLDEIEKANPQIFDLFLQVFDAGRLTDAQGNLVDAQHAIWIMTSNIGTDRLNRNTLTGFRGNDKETNENIQQNKLMEQLQETFRPEFLNRIDEIVVFHQLNKEQARAITQIQLNDLASRLAQQNLTLHTNDSVIDLLCEEGFSPTFGARPLRRIIEKKLTIPLSIKILQKQHAKSGNVYVNVKDNELIINIAEI